MLVERVFQASLKYLDEMPKEKRKAIGQFFTSPETARYMASMFSPPEKENIILLDPGAGSGILTAAAVENLQDNWNVKHISITCYETSPEVLPLLKSNLEFIKSNSSIPIEYEVVEENYITSQSIYFNDDAPGSEQNGRYDRVICNPPYKKIAKNAPEAASMPSVCHGAPNLYFLFSAMSLFNLKDYGEMVFIIPRSWTSGAYFKKFRDYLLSEGTLKQLHLFVSRDKVFEKESVLQETIIIKITKSRCQDLIKVTCSNSNSDFNAISEIQVPYDQIVVGAEKFVYLPTNINDLKVLKTISQWPSTLLTAGFKMRTGLTVDFRCVEYLRNEPEKETVPLLYAQHIKNGKVVFPIHREYEYITAEKSGLIQRNKNYLIVKRFTTKEEVRRLQCGIYLADSLPEYSSISTHNKINFIEGIGFDLSEKQLYGLYVIFNSTLYDQYFRIMNGSTQVNSTEVNAMPVPSRKEIERLGAAMMENIDLSVERCDKILGGLINECY